jgi:DNA-binding NarL/FixJ family response regulator
VPQAITVIICDDDDDIRRLLRVNLEIDGRFNVVNDVPTGAEAFLCSISSCPDVLVLDLMMPGMNGAQVLAEVRNRCPHTKIAMFTAATIGVAASLTGEEADMYLGKSELITDVVNRIASLAT